MSDDASVRLAACTQVITEYFRDESEALLAAAREPLLVAARDTTDRDEEDRLVSVLEEVETLTPQVSEVFFNAVLGALSVSGAPSAQGVEASGDDGLSLVDTAKVDDWLRLRGMLERQSDAARQFEETLWKRLAALAGVESNADSNPLSLHCTCEEFQAAMQGLAPGRDARAAIYDAFEATVAGNLNHLAAQLQVLLDEDVEALPPTAARSPDPGDDADDAVDAVAQAPPDSPGSDPRDSTVDPSRLLGAMAAAQRREPDSLLADMEDLEAWLLHAIAPRGTGVNLDEAERRTVAAVSRLVRQIVQDPDVELGVQRRLSHLAPPLLMLALQDEGYLEAEIRSARYDPVTGLLDRTAFRSRLESACRRSVGATVCLVDVDGFRDVTQRLGHQVGGRLLRALADMLRKQAGTRNVVARLRGDEFAVLLPRARPGAGRRFAERFLSSLAGARFSFDGEQVNLRASIGVVESGGALNASGDLMRAVDAARKMAKADGGGCVRVAATE